MPFTHPRPILFISNGLGEDSMSSEIIRGLPVSQPAHAYPMIADGSAFNGLCDVVGPRSYVPSQGWRHARWSVLRDFTAIAASIPPAIRFLRRSRQQYDRVAVVGDTSAVILGAIAGLRVDIYVDVFKTGYAHQYSQLELWAIKQTVKKVFCRDGTLASRLQSHGIDAVSHGNIMLDTVTRADIELLNFDGKNHVVGLLPGSRATTPEAFALQIDALEVVARRLKILVLMAVADGIDIRSLADSSRLAFEPYTGSNAHRMGRLAGRGLHVNLFRAAAGNVMEASNIVLSQAGTATQQALGLGKPVITYYPPEHRKKRMDDEQALMGEARILLPPDPNMIARETIRLLRDSKERVRLGEIGRERLGGPGTLDAVIQELLKK
jgi:uncharacterized protein (TIGR03492 family)